jgi:hypothetical protein
MAPKEPRNSFCNTYLYTKTLIVGSKPYHKRLQATVRDIRGSMLVRTYKSEHTTGQDVESRMGTYLCKGEDPVPVAVELFEQVVATKLLQQTQDYKWHPSRYSIVLQV